MKKVYLFVVLNSLFIHLSAQNFQWAKREGYWAYDYGYGITTDNSGNVYVAGKYEGTANFSGTILPCQGNHDIFVAQYNPLGTLNWIRTAGGLLGDYAHAIDCDGSNYLYVAGEIEGVKDTITFVGSTIKLVTKAANDAFLAKYDLNGNLLWARSAGAYQDDKALGVTHDKDGNVFICGYFNDTAFFGTTTIYGKGMNDIYVAKYDKDGVFQWVRHAGSAGRDEAKSIKCDALGNVYVCGMYTDGCSFGSQTLTSPLGYFNTFLAKYSNSGTLLWVNTAGGDYDDVAWSLTLDNAGKVYVAGEFNAYALFDAIPLTTAGQAEAFVACYDANGNVQWAKSAGDSMAAGNMITRARGIGSDGNDLYITGQFGGTATFGSIKLTAVDSSDVFMAKLNNAGTFMWATAVGGKADSVETLGYESGNDICADASGNVYATGSLLDGGVFGATSYTTYGRTDAFVTKITQVGVDVLPIDKLENITIYPNPNNGIMNLKINQFENVKRGRVDIYNIIGEKVFEIPNLRSSNTQIDLSAHEKRNLFYGDKNR